MKLLDRTQLIVGISKLIKYQLVSARYFLRSRADLSLVSQDRNLLGTMRSMILIIKWNKIECQAEALNKDTAEAIVGDLVKT